MDLTRRDYDADTFFNCGYKLYNNTISDVAFELNISNMYHAADIYCTTQNLKVYNYYQYNTNIKSKGFSLLLRSKIHYRYSIEYKYQYV